MESLLLIIPMQLEAAQQQNRELEEAWHGAESRATQTETQLVAEKRQREGEGREREEKAWELTKQLRGLQEQLALSQAKVTQATPTSLIRL